MAGGRVSYFMASRSSRQARSQRSVTGRYSDPDYGLSFDNTGKNGHFREFAWQA